jgi:NAD(P)-dependent dehydrogenase (short-subunit alcohol dehydrogenase family)
LSRLAADALAGLDIAYAGDSVRPLAGGLVALGARIAVDDAPVDLLLVPLDGASSLDDAADGALAAALTAAFSTARDGASRLRPGGCLLLVLAPAGDLARAAVESLTRTLARECAPALRVNAIACADPADAVDLAALVAWRASRPLTGAILDAAA